jgi:hypothetical protein
VSVESPFRQHTQFDLEQDYKMNMTYQIGLALEASWPAMRAARVSYFALKRGSPAVDRISMSALNSAQPPRS